MTKLTRIGYSERWAWKERRLHPCQGICESNIWHYKNYGNFPQCKKTAEWKYKRKEYCTAHLGHILIKEKLNAAASDT